MKQDTRMGNVTKYSSDVVLCSVCELPLCVHERCINKECRLFQQCRCLVVYAWNNNYQRAQKERW